MCGRFSLWLELTDLIKAFPDFVFPEEHRLPDIISHQRNLSLSLRIIRINMLSFSAGDWCRPGQKIRHWQPDD